MPESWRAALHAFLPYAAAAEIDWMLVGSAATAAHGAKVIPGDVDVLVRTPQDVERLANVLEHLAVEQKGTQDASTFLSSREQPLLIFADGNWTFGRWVIAGTRVEVACIREPGQEDRLAETYGEPVWQERQVLEWQGVQVPIVPLEVQMATLLARGYEGRVQAAAVRLQDRGFDSVLLSRALTHRGVSVEDASRFPEVARLLHPPSTAARITGGGSAPHGGEHGR